MFEPDMGWKKYWKENDVSIMCIVLYSILGVVAALKLNSELYRYFWAVVAGTAGITSGMLITRFLGWRKYRPPWKFVSFFCAFNWYLMTAVSPGKSIALFYRVAAVAAVLAALYQWRNLWIKGRG